MVARIDTRRAVAELDLTDVSGIALGKIAQDLEDRRLKVWGRIRQSDRANGDGDVAAFIRQLQLVIDQEAARCDVAATQAREGGR